MIYYPQNININDIHICSVYTYVYVGKACSRIRTYARKCLSVCLSLRVVIVLVSKTVN